MVKAGVRPFVKYFFRMAVWYRYEGVGCWILFASVVELFIWGGTYLPSCCTVYEDWNQDVFILLN